MRKRGSKETIARQVCVTSIRILRSGVRRKSHAPFWSSGRRSDPSLDCNRLNLDLRQHVAAIGRRVATLCKGEDGLRHQLAFFQTYHNFCLPHASLRQPLSQPLPTHGHGAAKTWQPRTPAMAAGLTDHVWTLRTITTEYPSQVHRIANRYSEGDRSNAPIVWPHLSPHGDHDQATSGACLCRVAASRDRTYHSLRCHEPE